MRLRVKSNDENIIELTLYLLFCVLPFMDALNGFMYGKYGISGVGVLYHFVFTAFFLVMLCLQFRIRIGFFEKMLISLASIFVLSFVLNAMLGVHYESESVSRVIKIMCTFIALVALHRGVCSGVVSNRVLNRIIDTLCTLVPILTMFFNVTGMYNYAYPSSRSGRIGLFVSSNETTIIFVIISFFLLSRLYKKFSAKHFILLMLTVLCLILTEAKAGLGSVVVIMGCLFLHAMQKLSEKVSRKVLIWILCLAPVVVVGLIVSFDKMVGSFIARQTYLMSNYSSENIIYYLSSGRTGRFNDLLVTPIMEQFEKNTFGSMILGVIQFFLGFGLSNDYGSIFEMELFDILLYGGVIGWLVFVGVHVKIIRKTIKNQSKLLNTLGLLFVIICSCLIGHVWTGGVCGIYFALFATYLMCSKNENTNRMKREEL